MTITTRDVYDACNGPDGGPPIRAQNIFKKCATSVGRPETISRDRCTSVSETVDTSQQIITRSARKVTQIAHSGAIVFRHQRALIIIAVGNILIDTYNFTSIGFGLDTFRAQFGDPPMGRF